MVRHEKCIITDYESHRPRSVSCADTTMFLVGTLAVIFFLVPITLSQLHPDERAQYRQLPSLREQARILDGWRDERLARLPQLLHKYKLDAWLVGITKL